MSKRTGKYILGMLLAFCFSSAASAYTVNNAEMEVRSRGNLEYAEVYGYQSGSTQPVWVFATDAYKPCQLSSFMFLGIHGDRVLLVENGKLEALDREDGHVLWENDDFGGSAAPGCYAVSSTGKVYLAGYDGPDLFIADADGTTLSRIESFGTGLYWPYHMEFGAGNDLEITYECDESTVRLDVTTCFGVIE